MKTYEVVAVETGEILNSYTGVRADIFLDMMKSQYLINRVEQDKYNEDTIIVWVHLNAY